MIPISLFIQFFYFDVFPKVLSNKTKPLKYGYFGVVNRSQDSIDKGIGMGQTKNTEQKIFDDPKYQNTKMLNQD